MLTQNGMSIRMTEKGDPLENAMAERINGIIKEAYLDNYDSEVVQQAREFLRYKLYN